MTATWPLRTLRGRLAGAMAVIFVMAVGGSALLNRLGGATVPPAPVRQVLASEPIQDGLVLAAFCLPALLIIWLISSWSLRPLVRASAEARRVGPRNPAARISRAGMPAEITPLVDAVNGALDRMAEAFEAERRFTENAAHELRTPLTVLGLRLQRARHAQERGEASVDWPAIDGDVAQMNRLVGQLLDLARKQNTGRAGTAAEPEVNMARLAREASAMLLPLAEAEGRTIAVDMPENLFVRVQAEDLRDALCNLLENAVLHGEGAIALHGAVDGTEIVLRVSDQGPGIAPGLEQAVFERFRKDSRSAGTGLGLAIVQEVVRAHGGSTGFVRGPECQIEMRLPPA